ncbi:MAG TPA: pyridoxal-phosphate dependent enzyme, partial [Sporichthyaceae bacterium]
MTTVSPRAGQTHQWRGVIEEYRDRLPVEANTPVVTLLEGGTPLVPAPVLSEMTGCEVYLKVEGANPTGSFKDRGMTMAISRAAQDGARAVICASTGNTSASAAAYAVRAGMVCAVLVPQGKIALGKMSQALVHGSRILQVDGNFDDCLELARGLSESYPVALVNSVNPY